VNEAGYTLTEALAAMAVIGLAAGGFSVSMQVLGRQQSGVGEVVLKASETRQAEAWLERRLAPSAPYRSVDPGSLSGDAEGFRFACEAAASCDVRITQDDRERRWLEISGDAAKPARFRLPGKEPAHFVYRGAGDPTAAWPPSDGARQALRAIALIQGEGTHEHPVLELRVLAEQPLDCAYDPVLRDCR
jgi:hypothetical protein